MIVDDYGKRGSISMAVVCVLAGFLAAVILAPVVAGGYWELNIKAE